MEMELVHIANNTATSIGTSKIDFFKNIVPPLLRHQINTHNFTHTINLMHDDNEFCELVNMVTF